MSPIAPKKYDHRKYQAFAPIPLENRTWPDQQITKAPKWCSVDLRDGNQALINPMTVDQKSRLFDLLVSVGFKEIEVGFPAASQPDYDFVRLLIEEDRIPDDVTIQILTQAREDLIARSFEALHGARRAIVHLYNSTSIVQRENVFNMTGEQIIEIAKRGARWIKNYAEQQPNTQWAFQYSPESFTATELDYSVLVCNAVMQEWQPTAENPVILNLPATVETATANVYADQIEYFCRKIQNRDAVIISLHTHNDRGCAVSAAELGIMAGAQRVEGTLFGNGERTGNMDVVTMAMNLYSQGIDPELDFSTLDDVIRVVEDCTEMPLHPRHPYAGELVYTAFSGSHQDAIKKCLEKYQEGEYWTTAYLPIDPRDIGRTYQSVIRINSQSGKGGIAYVLDQNCGLKLPRWLQIEFSAIVQSATEKLEQEISPEAIVDLFKGRYLSHGGVYSLESYTINSDKKENICANILINKQPKTILAEADGVLEAFVVALRAQMGLDMDVINYTEHSLGKGVEESAAAYVLVRINEQFFSGVHISKDIITASFNAVLSAINQYCEKQKVGSINKRQA